MIIGLLSGAPGGSALRGSVINDAGALVSFLSGGGSTENPTRRRMFRRGRQAPAAPDRSALFAPLRPAPAGTRPGLGERQFREHVLRRYRGGAIIPFGASLNARDGPVSPPEKAS